MLPLVDFITERIRFVLLLLIGFLLFDTVCVLLFFCVEERLATMYFRDIGFFTVWILLLLVVIGLTVLRVFTRTELVLTC